jgi:hypothetical protein
MEPLSQNLKKKQVLLEVTAFLQPSRPKTALVTQFLFNEKKKKEKKKREKTSTGKKCQHPFQLH